jgi:peptidoglycan/LPS O-acetylase OafA/YrhL
VTEPGAPQPPAADLTEPAAEDGTGARRAGALSGGAAAVLLVAAVVAFLAGGHPYATDVAGVVLYVLGLAAGLCASVLLWVAAGTTTPGPRRSRALGAAAVALLLVCASGVLSLGRAASGGAQLVLAVVTAAALAAAVVLGRSAAR